MDTAMDNDIEMTLGCFRGSGGVNIEYIETIRRAYMGFV